MHFDSEEKSKNYPDAVLHPYKRSVTEIICNSCDSHVTATTGCDSCHETESQDKETTS